MYNDPNCKPWTSSTWAPAGYSSRYDLVEQTKAAQARKPLASGALEEKRIEHADKPNGNGIGQQQQQFNTGYNNGGDIGAGFGGAQGEKMMSGGGGVGGDGTGAMGMPEPQVHRRLSNRVTPPVVDGGHSAVGGAGVGTGGVQPGRMANVDSDPQRGLQGGVGLTKEGPAGGIGKSEVDGHGNRNRSFRTSDLGHAV